MKDIEITDKPNFRGIHIHAYEGYVRINLAEDKWNIKHDGTDVHIYLKDG